MNAGMATTKEGMERAQECQVGSVECGPYFALPSSPQALNLMTALPLCCQLKQRMFFLGATTVLESCKVTRLCQNCSLVTTLGLGGFRMIK